LDYALHFENIPIDYGFSESGKGIPVLKLHGSLNFIRCSRRECNQITSWSLDDFFNRARWSINRIDESKPARLTLTRNISKNLAHCGQQRSDDPMIVPPTWNKTQHHEEIASIWQRAARELSDAENIIVIGYSLPATDHFFRYLYGLGTIGERILKRFLVFDPDSTGRVQQRYEEMLAENTKKRFERIGVNFEKAINIVPQKVHLY
jgi:hypothetical protein